MATRIGRYIFEDDLERMSVEKLKCLREACEHFIDEKRMEEIHHEFTHLNLMAHSMGFHLCYQGEGEDPQVLNEYNFKIVPRKELDG